MKAMFPGMKCEECGSEFRPGTEIEVHPTIRGPQGGKRYLHANPAQCRAPRRNPRGKSGWKDSDFKRMGDQQLTSEERKSEYAKRRKQRRASAIEESLTEADRARIERNFYREICEQRLDPLEYAAIEECIDEEIEKKKRELRRDAERKKRMEAAQKKSSPPAIGVSLQSVLERRQTGRRRIVRKPKTAEENPYRSRARRNPSTSAKLEAIAKKYGKRSKAGKLASMIARELKGQGL